MDLQTYLAVLRRWWTTLIIAALIAGIGGFVGARAATPVYEAEARLLVGPVSTDINTIRAASALSETYAQLVTSDEVLNGVRETLGIQTPLDLFSEEIHATADGTTRLLIIRVRSNDADGAAAIANELSSELLALQAGDLVREEGRLTVVQAALPPAEPVEPNVPLLTLMAAAVGFFAAGLLILGIEYFSDTFSTQYELERAIPGSFLGAVSIPRGFRATPSDPLIVEAFPESRSASAFRLLASKISATVHAGSEKSVLVVGCQQGDSAGQVTANIAAVLARTGRSVLVIDANDLEGQISRLLSVEERPGATELLGVSEASDMSVMLDAVATRRPPGVMVVSRGGPRSDLIDVDRARALIEATQKDHDLVLVNAGPVHRSGSALVWARVTDATLIVAQRDMTRRENLALAMDGLHFVGAAILGVTMLDRPWSRAFRSSRRPRAQASVAPVPSEDTTEPRPAERPPRQSRA